MKTILSILLLSVVSSFGLSLTNNINGHVTLAWSCNTNDLTPDLSFNVYQTTNINLPLSQWTLITNVMATNYIPYQVTNGIATNFYLSLDIQPATYFFVANASNFWGESGISNYAQTPPVPPVVGNTLKIQKAP